MDKRSRYRQMLDELVELDDSVFDSIAATHGPVLDGLMPKLTNAAATASSGSVSPASCPPSEGPVDSVPPCGASRPRASRVCWPTRC